MQTPVTFNNIHGLVVLPNIANTVKWIYLIHAMVNDSRMDDSDDFILFIDNCDLYFIVK